MSENFVASPRGGSKKRPGKNERSRAKEKERRLKADAARAKARQIQFEVRVERGYQFTLAVYGEYASPEVMRATTRSVILNRLTYNGS
ncbi:hypothetical protein DFH09DRAFT_1373270 [Mycena vulgaris]|nr:hypothetical protein DFH09DRAFT_1373270 [Mycena vulgaris]